MTDQQTGMSSSRKQRISTLLRFGLSILLFNLLVITMVVVSLQQSRRLYLERGEVATRNLTMTLEDSIEAVFDKADIGLKIVKYEAEKYLVSGNFNRQDIAPFIQRIHSFMPELDSLRITDAQGNVILGTGLVKRVNNAERDYFIKLHNDPKVGMVFAKPAKSQMSGKWVVSVARRLNNRDGTFAGVVYAQLAFDYFHNKFAEINIGPHGSIALLDSDMKLITRYPDTRESLPGGQNVITPEFKQALAISQEAGTFYTTSSLTDSQPRILSYHQIAPYPLYVIVGEATSDYLALWKKDSARALILLAIFIVTTLISAIMIYGRWQRQLVLTSELLNAKDQLELRVTERTATLEQRNHELAREVVERKQAEDLLHATTVELEQEIGERQCAQETLAIKHQQLEEINRTLEERVVRSVSELRSKDKLMIQQSRQAAMGEMINNIAHQWKQPLNNLGLLIQGVEYDFAAGLLTRTEMKSESNKCMDLISYMSQTIDDFRSFFREDKQKSDFGVRQSITRAIQLVSASLKDRDIKIIVEPGEELLINGYPSEYAQVMLNLLGNARDVLIERTVSAPLIKVNITAEAGSAFVTISDNGGGIREEIIASIFEPYFTTKQHDKGSGIGLFMSKTIIEKHMGGSLTVCNQDDGACFTVAIALRTPEDVTGRSNSAETEHLEG